MSGDWRSIQIIPATGWQARFLTVVPSQQEKWHAEKRRIPGESCPVICWALQVLIADECITRIVGLVSLPGWRGELGAAPDDECFVQYHDWEIVEE